MTAQNGAGHFALDTDQMPQKQFDEIFEEATEWLARLVLLYGVPFNYLIPEEAMLPKESIRFFFVDPIWIQCLVQGACSVGNNGYGDAIIDKIMNEWVQPNQPNGETQTSLPNNKTQTSPTNTKAAGVRDRLRLQYESVALPVEETRLDWPLTGFLLRSGVVEGWRGLEIMAYRALSDEERKSFDASRLTEEQKTKLAKEGVAPLNALRIEQLSKDVMLGTFNGIIAQLVIRQPQEGLHFGLTVADDGVEGPTAKTVSYTKTLREIGYKDPSQAGQILQSMTIDLSANKLTRDQEQKGVVKIADLADRMKSALSGDGRLENNKFTSAEFAVEMIEAAGEFTFTPVITTTP